MPLYFFGDAKPSLYLKPFTVSVPLKVVTKPIVLVKENTLVSAKG